MKSALLAGLALAALALPAHAQDAVPLLRVYIDAPYFYEITAQKQDGSDERTHVLQVSVEGKEVGSSYVTYDCENGEFGEDVVQEWTGGADQFLPAALKAYRNLNC